MPLKQLLRFKRAVLLLLYILWLYFFSSIFFDSNGKQKMKKTKKLKETTKDRHLYWNNYYSSQNFGMWVECTKCKKWRKTLYNESKDVPETWHCAMNITDNGVNGNCEDPEDAKDFLEYSPGSIVCAKIDGYPWWPAMVEEDPDVEEYYWKEANRIYYHVTFLDKKVTRSWVSSQHICSYQNQTNQNKFIVNFPKILNRKKHEMLLTKAEERAEMALKMSVKERFENFSFAHLYKGKFPPALNRETKSAEEITDALLQEINEIDSLNLSDSDSDFEIELDSSVKSNDNVLNMQRRNNLHRSSGKNKNNDYTLQEMLNSINKLKPSDQNSTTDKVSKKKRKREPDSIQKDAEDYISPNNSIVSKKPDKRLISSNNDFHMVSDDEDTLELSIEYKKDTNVGDEDSSANPEQKKLVFGLFSNKAEKSPEKVIKPKQHKKKSVNLDITEKNSIGGNKVINASKSKQSTTVSKTTKKNKILESQLINGKEKKSTHKPLAEKQKSNNIDFKPSQVSTAVEKSKLSVVPRFNKAGRNIEVNQNALDDENNETSEPQLIEGTEIELNFIDTFADQPVSIDEKKIADKPQQKKQKTKHMDSSPCQVDAVMQKCYKISKYNENNKLQKTKSMPDKSLEEKLTIKSENNIEDSNSSSTDESVGKSSKIDTFVEISKKKSKPAKSLEEKHSMKPENNIADSNSSSSDKNLGNSSKKDHLKEIQKKKVKQAKSSEEKHSVKSKNNLANFTSSNNDEHLAKLNEINKHVSTKQNEAIKRADLRSKQIKSFKPANNSHKNTEDRAIISSECIATKNSTAKAVHKKVIHSRENSTETNKRAMKDANSISKKGTTKPFKLPFEENCSNKDDQVKEKSFREGTSTLNEKTNVIDVSSTEVKSPQKNPSDVENVLHKKKTEISNGQLYITKDSTTSLFAPNQSADLCEIITIDDSSETEGEN